jgi:hypothetical protein
MNQSRLNILVTARMGRVGQHPAVHGVLVREGYTPISADGGPVMGRRTALTVPMLGERYDPDAVNALGQRGAFRDVPDVDGIRAAVAALRADWGPALHVQDNSGLVPELDDGPWRG